MEVIKREIGNIDYKWRSFYDIRKPCYRKNKIHDQKFLSLPQFLCQSTRIETAKKEESAHVENQ